MIRHPLTRIPDFAHFRTVPCERCQQCLPIDRPDASGIDVQMRIVKVATIAVRDVIAVSWIRPLTHTVPLVEGRYADVEPGSISIQSDALIGACPSISVNPGILVEINQRFGLGPRVPVFGDPMSPIALVTERP
jgi:hypothetical protein